ncbi:hypothetical protein AB0D34_46105, partial [Streptomyces sp. NPDC048420]|uniref:hypothetical protein n=1 Tax=Streptomyces sp. NPDC048420 TaxID=3155755 RepID=UPI003424CA35
ETRSNGITASAEHRSTRQSAPPGQGQPTYTADHETPAMTDEPRTSGPGPATANELYDAQDIGARREQDA